MRKSIFQVLGPTDPVYDLTTVEAVNAALGLESNTADDAITAAQITHTSRMIAALCDRNFALMDVSENFRVQWGEPVHALYLRQYPVEQVVSITQDGSEADSTMYELDDEAGLLWMKCGRWCGPVIAEYSGGYNLPDEAPALLAQACIEMVGGQRLLSATAAVDPNLREIQHGDTRIVYQLAGMGGSTTSSGSIPKSVSDLIYKYIRQTV